jgi:cytochrome c oxidase assembly protein subunit 11
LLLKFALIAVIMFGFGYLLVPFYEQICKATGLQDIDGPDKINNTQVDRIEPCVSSSTQTSTSCPGSSAPRHQSSMFIPGN